MIKEKITKEQVINYFKELGDNIPDGRGYTPDDCEGYCPFIEACRGLAGNLCDMIVCPEDYKLLCRMSYYRIKRK